MGVVGRDLGPAAAAVSLSWALAALSHLQYLLRFD